MLRVSARVLAIAVMLVGGCTFGLTATPDAGSDADAVDAGPPPPTIGFSPTTSTQDESSGEVLVTVKLSEPAPATVTVNYSFSGAATLGTDYTGTAGTLAFGIGETTRTIGVTILDDGVDEGEEMLVISLDSATGATIGDGTYTMTIAANMLPRVNLSVATSQVDEQTPVTITFTLDKAADGPVTVSFTAGGGTALPAGTPLYADYDLAPGLVLFPQGSLMQTVPLGVVNDTRNEVSETLEITLTTTTGVVIGTTGTQTHTILDNDTPPSIRFQQNSTNTPEGNNGTTQVLISVTLSTASGRTITAPISVAASSTAVDPSDYTVLGTTVTFTEGDVQQNYLVNVVGDGINELDEELNLTLAAPADNSATLGAQTTRRLNITNDDLWCVGTGADAICYLVAPTVPLSLPISINTTNSSLCQAQPSGWSQGPVCVITATNITMAGTTVVTGSRPLVLAASGTINVSSVLDAASHFGGAGQAPDSHPAACRNFAQNPGNNSAAGGGGGAGGSFMSKGGNGGVGDALQQGGTSAIAEPTPPTNLRGGCDGQRGGAAGPNSSGSIGSGGGAVYLAAGTSITISSVINVSGSAADAGGANSGGSGAGTGGMIRLFAPAINATGGVLMANGGGGASGGSISTPGNPGSDPSIATPFTSAPGGPNTAGGGGGQGHAGSTAPAAGESVLVTRGGGGGGGGGGYIKANVALTGAMVSAGLVQAP